MVGWADVVVDVEDDEDDGDEDEDEEGADDEEEGADEEVVEGLLLLIDDGDDAEEVDEEVDEGVDDIEDEDAEEPLLLIDDEGEDTEALLVAILWDDVLDEELLADASWYISSLARPPQYSYGLPGQIKLQSP